MELIRERLIRQFHDMGGDATVQVGAPHWLWLWFGSAASSIASIPSCYPSLGFLFRDRAHCSRLCHLRAPKMTIICFSDHKSDWQLALPLFATIILCYSVHRRVSCSRHFI